jgi:hypothetical protein
MIKPNTCDPCRSRRRYVTARSKAELAGGQVTNLGRRRFVRVGDCRMRVRTAGALTAVLGAVVALAGCTSTSATNPRTSPPPPIRNVPRVSFVRPPPAGCPGSEVAVSGTVEWVTLGLPGCALLWTDDRQTLSLVGPLADQRRRNAAAHRGPVSQRVQVSGYVPAAVASACGGALSLSVTQVSLVSR